MHPKIKKMIYQMHEKESKKRKKSKKDSWFLYILRCYDGSFYTGITKDLENRFNMHNKGKASRYTRVRRPVEMLYQERCGTHSDALMRECAVKALSRKRKKVLVCSPNKD